MNQETTLSKEEVKQAAKAACDYFEARLSLERERLMGFYDKDKLRGILDDVRNPDAWASAIDKLEPPELKYFEVAHNRYHLKQIFTHVLFYKMEEHAGDSVPKEMVVSTITEAFQYFSSRKWGYGISEHGYNKALDQLAIESLKKFARDLGITHLVSAAQSGASNRSP